MSWLRRAALSLLALSVLTMGFVIPAQTANAAGTVNKVIVWGDSMSLAWGAYLEPLLGVPVERKGVGSEDVQQTEARFITWFNAATPAQRASTGHLCWCGHVNNNPEHVGTNKDVSTVVPTLLRMAGKVPAGLFMPIGMQNGPDAPQPSEGYHLLVNTPPYDNVHDGTAVSEKMFDAFESAYAEVRRYLVTDGLRVANIQPTAEDNRNIAVDVPPASLRRVDGNPNDPHLSTAGKQVTASRLNDLIREDGWIAPSQGQPSTTNASSTVNPSQKGQAIKFTATVRPASGTGTPDGSVQFFVNGRPSLEPIAVPPSGVVTSTSTAALAVGQHIIQAVYSGSSTYASSSGSFTQVVNGTGGTERLATSTTITSSQNPVPTGTKVRFSATVADASGQGGTVKPTGTVQFYRDGNLLGSARTVNTSGKAVTPLVLLPTGTHTITAVYSGNTKYNGSNGGPYSQVVGSGGGGGPLASATAAVSNPASPTAFGVQFRVNAQVTNSSGQPGATPTGTVQFKIDGKNAGLPVTLSPAGAASSILSPATLARGNHTVTVTYSGSATYLASTYTYTHVVT